MSLTPLRCADCGRTPREGWLGFPLFAVVDARGTRQVSTCCYRPEREVAPAARAGFPERGAPTRTPAAPAPARDDGQRSLGLGGGRP